jgi:hypothetical protein
VFVCTLIFLDDLQILHKYTDKYIKCASVSTTDDDENKRRRVIDVERFIDNDQIGSKRKSQAATTSSVSHSQNDFFNRPEIIPLFSTPGNASAENFSSRHKKRPRETSPPPSPTPEHLNPVLVRYNLFLMLFYKIFS